MLATAVITAWLAVYLAASWLPRALRHDRRNRQRTQW